MEGIQEMAKNKSKEPEAKEPEVVEETAPAVDWEAKYKELEAKSKEADKPKPVSEDMSVHAYSHEGQLDVENLDPAYHYRWVSKLDKKLKTLNSMNVSRKKNKGYEVVTTEENNIVGPSMGGTTIETNDLILMRTSKENAAKIQKAKTDKAKRAVRTSNEDANTPDFEGTIKHKKQSYDSNLQMMDDSDSIFSE
jgi:hypothetical protein